MTDLRATLQEALADAERTVEKLRAALAALGPDPVDDTSADFDESSLMDSGEAAQRFEVDKKRITSWCRDKGIGVKQGGRWLVSIPRLRRHLGRDH